MPFSRPDPFLPGTHRALVVLRFLPNNLHRTVCFWPNYTILFHTYTDSRSAETGEIFGLARKSHKIFSLEILHRATAPGNLPFDELDPVAVGILDEEAVGSGDLNRLLDGDPLSPESSAGSLGILHKECDMAWR